VGNRTLAGGRALIARGGKHAIKRNSDYVISCAEISVMDRRTSGEIRVTVESSIERPFVKANARGGGSQDASGNSLEGDVFIVPLNTYDNRV